MNKQMVIRILHVASIVALTTALFSGTPQAGLSQASGAENKRPQTTPTRPAGTDWNGAAPKPDNPLDSSMPPLAVPMPSQQPVVVARTPDRPVIAAQASAPNAPAITLWYGTDQTFGQIGNPQGQINLLGNVTGTFPISLTYTLNGGVAQPLATGPDNQRLAALGDFNIAITRTNLISGLNQVVITASEAPTATTVLTANVTYVTGQTWPQNYSINWGTVTKIQDVAQVVDGLWAVDSAGLRPLQFDFDRLVAIGDSEWHDYEVLVPILVRGIDTSGFDPPSNGTGIGLIADWQGHTLLPQDNQVPTGWRTQLGALAWYRWGRDDTHSTELRGSGGGTIATSSSKELSYNVQYLMKLSVQSQAGDPSYYRFKLWPADQPEPATWDVEGPGRVGGPVSGSLLLVAHHVDATFGNVVVKPLDEITPTLSVATEGSGTVKIQPQSAQYDYGQTVQVTANGIDGSFFDRWSGDITSENNPLIFDITQNTALTATFVLTPTEPITSTIVSDDFNNCTLDPRWEFVNPLNDGTLVATGTRVQLTVPEGTSHNVYDDGIPAPRLMQAIDDTDFEVVAKFESSVNRRFQVQGIIVEQDVDADAEDFIRFDFFHDGANVHLYAATIANGVPEVRIDDIITPSGTEYYLKIRREGNVWTEQYSFNGASYTGNSFSLITPITVKKIGVFAANHGILSVPTSIPAHTAIVDYLFNRAAPIANEDGKTDTLDMTVTPEAGGTISVTNPSNATTFACGDQVTLMATPADGFAFDGWSGAVEGQTNPITFSFNLGDTVSATFVQDQVRLYLPLVRKGS